MRINRLKPAVPRPAPLWAALWALCLLGSAAPAYAEGPANAECLDCHSEIEPERFAQSVHGDGDCVSCHSDIQALPHAEKLEPVSCSDCHDAEAGAYAGSDHGKVLAHGKALSSSCKDCHGDTHAILSKDDPRALTHRSNIHKTCAVCHEDAQKMAGHSLLEQSPVRSYSATVHGQALIEGGNLKAATCTDCHSAHGLSAPGNPASTIHRSQIPKTCGQCHQEVLKAYDHSVHGKAALAGKPDAPVCTDCHGEHTILGHLDKGSKVYAASVSEKVCAQCHAAERIVSKYKLPADSVRTYLDSYHGLASRYGEVTVANCASCHGAHDILPAADPLSSVHKSNLSQTCGKCHANAGSDLTRGSIHVSPSPQRDTAVYWVTVFYLMLIFVAVGGMVFHNLIDFIHKWRQHYRQKKLYAQQLRFTRGERIQHFLLIIAFFTLAYSGFALKHPEAWWAVPFTSIGAGAEGVRRLVHRAAAMLFILCGAYHVVYIALTSRGRHQLRELLLRASDLKDAWSMVGYNLGWLKKRPRPTGSYGYAEKVEYWALVWGSIVMVATGLALWAQDVVFRYLPKWAIDVAGAIHYYEAVLATLAIIVWHFYFVIFDPEHYPMNLSMITGKGGHAPHQEEDKKDTHKP